MDIKEYLNNVCKYIKYKPANKAISEELETHIQDMKSDYLCKGFSENEAEENAIKQMGDAKKIGKKLNKIHKPKIDWLILIFSIGFIYFGGQFWSFFNLDSYWNYRTNYSFWTVYYRLVCIELILGVLFTIFLFFYDYRKIRKHSKLLFILATALNIIAYFRGFRANGNLIYGLEPFTSTSPSVFTIQLYIIAFAGFIKDTDLKKIIVLSFIAIISSLIINFTSGFLVAIVYLIISARELLKRKQIKKTIMFIAISIILFAFLSAIICIIPTMKSHSYDNYTSANWVGVDTVGERRVDFIRGEIYKAAKLFGQADLEGISLEDEYGYTSSIQGSFGISGKFAFLGILSEYGWIASFSLVIILLIFDIKLILSTRKIKDQYGKLISIGITSLFIIQTICNLLMNFGIIGTTEFQLPLISGGKATFIANILCVSLFLSVYRRKDINFEEPKKSKIFTKIEDFFFEEVEE